MISMSGKGNCFDNATMVETFFKTLKAELRLAHRACASRTEATAAIGRYIDGFYTCCVRRHSALDFISPLQFERRAA